MTDPISDMLIRIKNASAVNKPAVSFGYSKLKFEIAKILESEGFIKDVEKKGKKNKKNIEAGLVYDTDGKPRFTNIKRISKLSKREYRGFREIFGVKNGIGIGVYSTPKGIKSDKEARKEKVGGEILFEIW
ncbi:30S ribosomal protein S8 [Candidatus Giovannonibacteria bacterium]|nr:30S ribosomal protein S8 [Candidatus Giovannonibacteria bacterium]